MAKKPTTLIGKIFAPLGSFWLAVVLLVNLFLLTWLGTLAQVEKGIHAVQEEYFESWLVFAEAGPLKLLLPGGYFAMGLLVVNLFVGGLVRIRKTKATIGIIIAHVGIALMMGGGLVEHITSQYGNIRLFEGETGDAFQEYAGWEVAIWDADQLTGIEEFLIPDEHFEGLSDRKTRTFTRPELPFDLTLGWFMPNCRPDQAVGVGVPTAPVVEDLFLRPEPLDKEEERNLAGVYATAVSEGGASVEKTFLWGVEQRPWVISAGGKNWAITLRHTMHEMPFKLKLVKFIKDDHPGMSMARAFSSDVIQIDADGTENPIRIEMNEPLRDQGLIIYQASYGPQDGAPGPPYSVLAVSVNPSDRIPWISVAVIAFGLLWTFLAKLIGFLGKESRRSAAIAAKAESEDSRAAA